MTEILAARERSKTMVTKDSFERRSYAWRSHVRVDDGEVVLAEMHRIGVLWYNCAINVKLFVCIMMLPL